MVRYAHLATAGYLSTSCRLECGYNSEDASPNLTEAFKRRRSFEICQQLEMSERHVSELAGILECIAPSHGHAGKTVCLPTAIGWQVGGFGTLSLFDMSSYNPGTAPAFPNALYVVFGLVGYLRRGQSKTPDFTEEHLKECIRTDGRTDIVPVACVWLMETTFRQTHQRHKLSNILAVSQF